MKMVSLKYGSRGGEKGVALHYILETKGLSENCGNLSKTYVIETNVFNLFSGGGGREKKGSKNEARFL